MAAVHIFITTTDGETLEVFEVSDDDKNEIELASHIRGTVESRYEFSELGNDD